MRYGDQWWINSRTMWVAPTRIISSSKELRAMPWFHLAHLLFMRAWFGSFSSSEQIVARIRVNNYSPFLGNNEKQKKKTLVSCLMAERKELSPDSICTDLVMQLVMASLNTIRWKSTKFRALEPKSINDNSSIGHDVREYPSDKECMISMRFRRVS